MEEPPQVDPASNNLPLTSSTSMRCASPQQECRSAPPDPLRRPSAVAWGLASLVRPISRRLPGARLRGPISPLSGFHPAWTDRERFPELSARTMRSLMFYNTSRRVNRRVSLSLGLGERAGGRRPGAGQRAMKPRPRSPNLAARASSPPPRHHARRRPRRPRAGRHQFHYWSSKPSCAPTEDFTKEA